MGTLVNLKNSSSKKLCSISGRHSLQGCPVSLISDIIRIERYAKEKPTR